MNGRPINGYTPQMPHISKVGKDEKFCLYFPKAIANVEELVLNKQNNTDINKNKLLNNNNINNNNNNNLSQQQQVSSHNNGIRSCNKQ